MRHESRSPTPMMMSLDRVEISSMICVSEEGRRGEGGK